MLYSARNDSQTGASLPCEIGKGKNSKCWARSGWRKPNNWIRQTTHFLYRVTHRLFNLNFESPLRGRVIRLSAEPFEELYFLRAYRSGVLVFICWKTRNSIQTGRESSPKWAACHGYFYALLHKRPRGIAQGEEWWLTRMNYRPAFFWRRRT